MIPSSDCLLRDIVPSGFDSGADSFYSHIRGVQPEIQQCDCIAGVLSALDNFQKRPCGKGCLDCKVLFSFQEMAYLQQHEPAGLDRGLRRIERGEAFCELIRIHKFLTVEHFRQQRIRSRGLAGSVTS